MNIILKKANFGGMKGFFFYFFLLLVPLFYAQNFKELSQNDACIKKIKSTSLSTTSIKADFNELRHSTMFKNPIPGKGQLFFQKKDNIRWEQTSPNKNTILISKGKIKIQENGKEVKNVAANQVAKKIQDLMLQLISGDFLQQNEFSITYFESTSQYKLHLVPKNKRLKKYIQTIEIYFEKESGLCKQIVFMENESNYTSYQFVNQKINTDIPESTFNKF
jgi:outer membrane lipoprotein carrier protein